jgi:DNA-directed RNA polymerase specialized sigma subunit
LLRLNIVWREMEENDDSNPVRALRAILARAIEKLKPEGKRSLTTTEWILYNILEMRFLQGRKVRDVALRLAMSESDLYRKQRIAIEEVAHQIEEMERTAIADKQTRPGSARREHHNPTRQ